MTGLIEELKQMTFRSSPTVELVLYDRLSAAERDTYAEPAGGWLGVLRPTRNDRNGPDQPEPTPTRAVDRDTALLLYAMRDPGPIPDFALEEDPAGNGILSLILDGVIELLHEGTFVSGRTALELLQLHLNLQGPANRLARLSLEALEHVGQLDLEDPAGLAFRLYAFGRIPLSPHRLRQFARAENVQREILDGSPLSSSEWLRSNVEDEADWIRFQRRRRRIDVNRDLRPQGTYKLYVSPAPDSLRAAFSYVIDVINAHDVNHFKIGANASGLLRPDKLVVYFNDLAALHRVADELAIRLDGIDAHGVPFTSEIAGDGLLSWGMDPPATSRTMTASSRQSWRTWVTLRLAAFLLKARESSGTMSPARFAMERLRLEGVDVDRWLPSGRIWSE